MRNLKKSRYRSECRWGSESPAGRSVAALRVGFRTALAGSAATLLLSISALAAPDGSPSAFVAKYCVECHGPDKQKADRRFDGLEMDLTDLTSLETWQEVLDQINLGEMPPEKADLHPAPEEIASFVEHLTVEIAAAQEAMDAPLASPVVRRLNREQYDHTVRALLSLEPMLADPTESFPADITVDHFATVGSALVTSDFLMESYLKAAEMLIERATDAAEPPEPQKWSFEAPFSKLPARPDGLDEPGKYQHIRKNPHYEDGYLYLDQFLDGVPHHGYYDLTFKAQGINQDYPYPEDRIGVDKKERLRVGVVAGNPAYGDLKAANGSDRPLAQFNLPTDKPETYTIRIYLDKGYQPRFTFPNGPNRTKPFRTWTVTDYPEQFTEFIRYISPEDGEFRRLPKQFFTGDKKRTYSADDTNTKLDSQKFYTNKNSNDGWSAWTRAYEGPRVRIYSVQLEGPFYPEWPTKSHFALYKDVAPTMENARAILTRFAFSAFRRPASPEEIDILHGLAKAHHESGHSEKESVQLGLQAILCSPAFLYLEKDDPNAALAASLSYFLWSETPDYNLRKINDLSDPKRLQQAAERMIRDARIDRFVETFTDGWLQLDKVGTQLPSHTTFPEYYTHDLQEAMIAESRLFFKNALQTNRPITEFLDADYTYLNGPLAKHYGIDGVVGSHMRKVKVYDRRRGGLLGQAAVHTASANGIDTSPVIRGIWVLENILGTPPSPPPPDIEPIEPDTRGTTTIREQLQKHRDVETCAECHRKIDPIGFAMENFDPIGGWRDVYEQTQQRPSVDATGQFPDGTAFEDIVDLRVHLVERKKQFAHMLTEKLLVYATGRTLTVVDRPHVDRIVMELEKKSWGLQDLVHLVIQSPMFLGDQEAAEKL